MESLPDVQGVAVSASSPTDREAIDDSDVSLPVFTPFT